MYIDVYLFVKISCRYQSYYYSYHSNTATIHKLSFAYALLTSITLNALKMNNQIYDCFPLPMCGPG